MTVMTRPLILAIAGVLLLSTSVQVQSGDDARRPASKQWPAVSGDWGTTRHSTLNQITAQNITKLGGAWTSQKFDAPAGARTMPIVHDGLMFLTAPPSVYALNAKTGERVWRFQAGLQSGMGAPAREGVAVGDGL
jgi:glucose dehydrogenase